ncbi:MAG: CBS domain-containing protein, partial [Caldibacillus sp.]
MTTDVETVGLNETIYDVAVKMKELNVGAIPVVDGE